MARQPESQNTVRVTKKPNQKTAIAFVTRERKKEQRLAPCLAFVLVYRRFLRRTSSPPPHFKVNKKLGLNAQCSFSRRSRIYTKPLRKNKKECGEHCHQEAGSLPFEAFEAKAQSWSLQALQTLNPKNHKPSAPSPSILELEGVNYTKLKPETLNAPELHEPSKPPFLQLKS